MAFIKTRKGDSRIAVKRTPENRIRQSFFLSGSGLRSKINILKNETAILKTISMAFFTSAITTLQVLVTVLGAGLGVWGVINLLEGYGNDNPWANVHVR